MILEIAKLIKVGFLQQNAFHDLDTYVPLEKQYRMLKIIDYLYEKCRDVLKLSIPISQIKNSQIFGEILKMKYTVSNEDFSKIDEIQEMIDKYYDELEKKYLE